jgi:hypothetical protein
MVIAASKMIKEKKSSLLVLISHYIPEEPTRGLVKGTPTLQEVFNFKTPQERCLFLVNSADKTVINFPLAIDKQTFEKHEINEGHLLSWARYHFLNKEYKLGEVALRSVRKKPRAE